ncbi:tRNA lysidine(34) synthetase TilS [Lactobacillus sp. ESL0791]|uniref:tRNA lysidine(34) synthetase TilS n=1 Tax=Lactobacillus sp. ESL0791 TaxID=2983234 RepID=UPI0023F91E95|nr:tRNA lysidine(34) synthetase TilS [Lactobacillus sp. ESL0791]MDF7639476.1 tRNA lysidine(34) synthetase TilS [Lactobacillus sp. ESL0791]
MKQVIDFFKAHNLPLINRKLVVAVSAGPDSMALLALLNEEKRRYHFQLVAAHFDHQLRADSAKEAKIIKQYCAEHDIVFVSGKWQRHGPLKKGVEAAARKARYAFLVETVNQYHGDYLLTAHHNDDLLENILLKFIRSGDPSEMNSLQAVGSMHGVILLRPLLTWTKAELLAFDQAHQIAFVTDETNLADDTQRNRLRHHVVPLLKEENPKLGQNALNFSKKISLLNGFIDKEFAKIGPPQLFLNVAYRLSVQALNGLTSAQQRLYWQHFIWQKWHLRVNEHLAGFVLVTYRGYFYLSRGNLQPTAARLPVKLDQQFSFNGRQLVLTTTINKDLHCLGSFYAKPQQNFAVGPLPAGAKLLLQNGQHVKSKKKFAENSIPANLRPFCLTIYAGTEPVFVEQTYKQQTFSRLNRHYYLYAY